MNDPFATDYRLRVVHDAFTRWLGPTYDLDALDAVLATAAVEQLDGDPVWLLMISGSGNAKTETVQALSGAGAHVTSTITSEGALLSATSSREKAKDATGGLLRKVGPRGIVVIKDVTSVLSMNRDMRAAVLAALRETYDGRWERNVGTDGGRTLTWEGRLVVIGAVTTAWDRAHAVIASMGDRFALVRVDSTQGRLEAGRQALRNVGHEIQMRHELKAAVGEVLAGLDPAAAILPPATIDKVLAAAELVTYARTAVDRDYAGHVEDAHAPEAPTRFAKMLGQIIRGGTALGMDLAHAERIAMRVARDSMPPLRLAVLHDVADHPWSYTADVTKRVQASRNTVDRTLQELRALAFLDVEEVVDTVRNRTRWTFALAAVVDQGALKSLSRHVSNPMDASDTSYLSDTPCTDKPGKRPGRDDTADNGLDVWALSRDSEAAS